jgi:hypothetical protein
MGMSLTATPIGQTLIVKCPKKVQQQLLLNCLKKPRIKTNIGFRYPQH